jgi:WD40 repeat protein
LLHTLQGWRTGLAFSPNGKTLAGCWAPSESSISLWDVATGKKTSILSGHSGVVAFSPNGKILGSGGELGSVKLWDIATGICVSSFNANFGNVDLLVFSPNGKLLATAGIDYFDKQGANVAVRDVATLEKTVDLEKQTSGVKTLAFSPDGKVLACGGRTGGRIILWNVENGKVKSIIQEDKNTFVSDLAFSPDGKLLASAAYRTGNKLPQLVSVKDGGAMDRDVKLWDVATGEVAATLVGHSKLILSVAFSPSGRLLASSSDDKTIRIWDVASKRTIATLGTKHFANHVVFSPDGRYLAAASRTEGSVTLWGLPHEGKQ